MLLRYHVVLLSFGSKLSLGVVTVPLALPVLLVRVLYGNLLAQQVLAIHCFPRRIRSLEGVVGHETIALGNIVLVTDDGRWRHQGSELREGIEQDLLVYLLIQIVDEQLGANVSGLLLVGACFVDADGLLVQADAVEDLGGIVGALRGVKLDETITLMCTRHTIHGHVDVVHGAHLGHELPEVGLADALVEIADIDGGVLILLPGLFQHVSQRFQLGGQEHKWLTSAWPWRRCLELETRLVFSRCLLDVLG